MVQTYSDGKRIYSVDMMFAYINICKLKSSHIEIDLLKHNLEYKGWGNVHTGKLHSPLSVLKHPNKYKSDTVRIKKANLKYPIIVHIKNKKVYIVDGVHRLCKAILEGRNKIKVYIFDTKLMNKFLLNTRGNWNKVDKIPTYEYIELFHERFVKKLK